MNSYEDINMDKVTIGDCLDNMKWGKFVTIEDGHITDIEEEM